MNLLLLLINLLLLLNLLLKFNYELYNLLLILIHTFTIVLQMFVS